MYAQRAKIALLEKGIPHKVELIEKEKKSKEFLDTVLSITSNPAKATVPTIVGKTPGSRFGELSQYMAILLRPLCRCGTSSPEWALAVVERISLLWVLLTMGVTDGS